MLTADFLVQYAQVTASEHDMLANCSTQLPSVEEYFDVEYNKCKPNEYRCIGETCIPDVDVCNGIRDCPLGEEEGGFCGMCEIYRCEWQCRDTPAENSVICRNSTNLQFLNG
ncbi:low-density lipoprotein receptor domain class A domain-containing protein [Ditylenchus destructor]|uniref:Low-density lipoprotein receptor domain class A domain-containing protein n=1 Tax=Ditylenchus destructor TaxID=166010 RepID=A0AAD4MPV8_9BILA|nr:low-density lipoprotein receptor domain class A domain-containing protein [Ditylenchus destructor]